MSLNKQVSIRFSFQFMLLIGVFATSVCAQECDPEDFYPVSNEYPAGDLPLTVAVDDLNGDGFLDLVIGNNQPTISILLGNAAGTFADASQIEVFGSATHMTISDLDGDGALDLIVTHRFLHKITIMKGDGLGGFVMLGAPVPASLLPESVEVYDFNGDQISDLAVEVRRGIAIRLGTEGGYYHDGDGINVSGSVDFVAGKFDGDDEPDLAILTHDAIVLCFGNGDGTFGRSIEYELEGNPKKIESADLNNDMIPDLAIGNLTGDLSVMLGRGDGTFQKPLVSSGELRSKNMILVDLDKDNVLDVVGADTNYAVRVMIGTGDGRFVGQDVFPVACGGDRQIDSGDFDGDGNLDIVITNNLRGVVKVLPGIGGGRLLSDAYAYPTLDEVIDVGYGDFNKDGLLDLIFTMQSAVNPIGVMFGTESGQLENMISIASEVWLGAITVGDFDGNGHVDFVVARSALGVYLGDGHGGFVNIENYALEHDTSAITHGDFDNDGDLDIATANADADSMSVFLNIGNGAFGPPSTLITGDLPQDIASLNVNNDAYDDLVVVNRYDDNIGLYLGIGDGAFSEMQIYNVGAFPGPLSTGDLDADGFDDVVVANYSPGENDISVLRGNSDGSMTSEPDRQIGARPIGLDVKDLNGDGLDDIAVARNSDPLSAVVLFSLPGSSLSDPMEFDVPVSEALLGVQLNGLGGFELVAVGHNQIAILFSDCETFTCLADLNHSGEVDALDLITLLSNWGECKSCLADFNDDLIVDSLDLTHLFSHWGPCD